MKLIVFIFILLLLIPEASALSKSYDPDTKTVSIKNNAGTIVYITLQQISVVSSLTQFQEEILIHSNINYSINPSTDFIYNYQKFKGNNSIYKVTWEIKSNQSSGEWILFNPVGKTLTAGSNYLIRLTLYKKAEIGTVNILSIPRMNGIDLPELTWWNTSWNYRIDNSIPDGARPYQIKLNISNNSAGLIGNTTHVNVSCLAVNCSDLRFTLDNTTALPYWFETNTSNTPTWGSVWVNVTGNGTVNMYYGNGAATWASNGNDTFIAWHGTTTTNYLDNYLIPSNNFIYESKINIPSGAHNIIWAVGNGGWNINGLDFQSYTVSNARYGQSNVNSVNQGQVSESPSLSVGDHDLKLIRNGTQAHFYMDNDEIGTGLSGISFPSVNMGLTMQIYTGITTQYYSFARYYASPEPVWAAWGINYTAPPVNILSNTTYTAWSATWDRLVNVIWYINGTSVQTDNNVATATYTNNSNSPGIWIINATGTSVSNNSQSISQLWTWIINDTVATNIEQIFVSIS